MGGGEEGGQFIATQRNDASRQVERTSRIISAALRRCFVPGYDRASARKRRSELIETRENVRGHATTKLLDEREFRRSVAIRNKRGMGEQKPRPFFSFSRRTTRS